MGADCVIDCVVGPLLPKHARAGLVNGSRFPFGRGGGGGEGGGEREPGGRDNNISISPLDSNF